jgi:hypothetical protein
VAGLAAALVTKYGHNHAYLIRQRIIESADDLGAPGWDPYYGWGRVNVARAGRADTAGGGTGIGSVAVALRRGGMMKARRISAGPSSFDCLWTCSVYRNCLRPLS